MKAMMRDKIGSFAAASSVEEYLNRWLTQYVLLDDNASQEQKAQFPLREASVQVAEVPGRPGVYRAVSFLRPHFQLDELSMSMRLVASGIKPPGSGCRCGCGFGCRAVFAGHFGLPLRLGDLQFHVCFPQVLAASLATRRRGSQ